MHQTRFAGKNEVQDFKTGLS